MNESRTPIRVRTPLMLAVIAQLALLANACTDRGVIGTQPACEPECRGGLTCNLDLQSCVECAIAEDCPADTPYCEGFSCAQCRDEEDCPGEQLCGSGVCVDCVDDDDCSQPLSPFEVHVCDRGRCVDRIVGDDE